MITASERIVTVTIWVLTTAGSFFGARAFWRRRKRKRAAGRKGSDGSLKPNPQAEDDIVADIIHLE